MGNSPKGENMLERNKIIRLLGIGGVCLFLLGCSKEEFFLLKKDSSTVVLEEVIAMENVVQDGKEQENISDKQEEKIDKTTDIQEEQGDNIYIQEQGMEIAVHICGAVKQPGVYYLKEKQRVFEGIQKAGGFREDAAEDYLNQALFLEDGMKIVVPTKDEVRELESLEQINKADRFLQEAGSVSQKETKEKKVDLNTADEALLCTLPGIGESRAKSILAYRKEHGAFQKAEDIMNVSGIKEAAYEKIKDYVTVSQ